MSASDVVIWRNRRASTSGDATRLSVAIPFHNEDVVPLASELLTQAERFGTTCELLFADDGSADARWRQALEQRLATAPVAASVLHAPRNLGRGPIRNRLAAAARGEYILLLDADMLPDADDYLARYLALIEQRRIDALVGGRSYHRVRDITAAQQLYVYFSMRTECLSAAQRALAPARHCLTNNLVVRRSLLIAQPFCEDTVGWGYEDIEWALRLGGTCIQHIDNAASHFGLVDEATLLAKLDESVTNFMIVAQRQPAFRQLPVYQRSAALARWPAPGLAPVCRWLAQRRSLPQPLRYAAVQGYKIACYAMALRATRGGANAGARFL